MIAILRSIASPASPVRFSAVALRSFTLDKETPR